MKIERKTLNTFEISKQNIDVNTSSTVYQREASIKDEELRTMFGLPRVIVESPKLNEFKRLIQNQSLNKQNKQSLKQLGPAGQYLHNNFRNTIMSHTKEKLRPLRRHQSLLEAYELEESLVLDKRREFQANSFQANPNQSSQKTIDILQKIIFKQEFTKKEDEKLQLQISRLPIIENKQQKRKQNLVAYESKYISPQLGNRRKLISSRSPVKSAKPRTPYLSGWETQSVQL